VAAKARQADAEAAPIRYVAELLGADNDSERAIRLLILLMVLCRDPLALTAAASARGATPMKAIVLASLLIALPLPVVVERD
jgi:hypothetical protein